MAGANRDEITTFCNELLGIYAYKDYGPQGMQFIGDERVAHVATAVSVNSMAIAQAATIGAKMLIVHHGLFWTTEPRKLHGAHFLRLQALEANNISLLGYHLALDAHPEVGNNILALKVMGGKNPQPFAEIGWGGSVLPDDDVFTHIKSEYPYAHIFAYGKMPPKKVCAVTGAAGNLIHEAAADGYDVFLTGELEEPSQALAKEFGISYVAAGHHNTERPGVQALGEKIAKEFGIAHTFIDIPNPA